MNICICRSLESVLEYNESDFEEVYGLCFEISREVFGELKNFNLIPNGDKIPVTLKNKYVNIACISTSVIIIEEEEKEEKESKTLLFAGNNTLTFTWIIY